MELSWTTFVLEIINFLVLVWILKRFLYKPVMQVIARRQAGIESTLAGAEALHSDASKLQEQYEGRLADWEKERRQARETLDRELEAERARKIAELQTELEQEQEKARVAETRRQADVLNRIEEEALVQGARFATRLLEQAAGPETETRLIEMLLTELEQLTEDRLTALRNNYGKDAGTVTVTTAFPLALEQQQRLVQTLEKITSPDITVRYEQSSELLAGIRIIIGAWILAADLQDELTGFVELTHGG